MVSEMKHLVAIVGPTGVGKSKLALELAQSFGGEIISADSRQVYRYLDIGTAKPSPKEQALVPHYLIDVVDPDQDFSLAIYQELARQVIDDLHRRGKLALLVGGSGLYVWSLLEGWQIPRVAPDPELRRELEARARAEGGKALYGELQRLDPVAAQRIDPRNIRRVIRALEVLRQGEPFSRLQQKGTFPRFQPLIIGLTTDRANLYRRIDSRVDRMIEKGLVEEVRSLAGKGYGFDLPSMSGPGYRQIGEFLEGRVDLPTAVQQIKYHTHRLARHQYAWFRLSDERICWFEAKDNLEKEVGDLVFHFLKRGALELRQA